MRRVTLQMLLLGLLVAAIAIGSDSLWPSLRHGAHLVRRFFTPHRDAERDRRTGHDWRRRQPGCHRPQGLTAPTPFRAGVRAGRTPTRTPVAQPSGSSMRCTHAHSARVTRQGNPRNCDCQNRVHILDSIHRRLRRGRHHTRDHKCNAHPHGQPSRDTIMIIPLVQPQSELHLGR